MAELTDEMKRQVVVMLACFKGPAEVVRELNSAHGIEATIRQIMAYDATGAYFKASEEHRTLFETARKAYVHDVTVVPIAQTAFRLNELMDLYAGAKKAGNRVLAASLLEQAAKDSGGVFSNVRVNVPVDPGDLSTDERRARLAALFDRSLGRDKQPTAPSTSTAQ